MNKIIDIVTESEFYNEIDTNIPVLVDFWAKWCVPCKMQSPVLHEIKTQLGDKIKVLKVDVDENGKLASLYDITSIPTIIILLNGEIKEKNVGLASKPMLSEMLIKYL